MNDIDHSNAPNNMETENIECQTYEQADANTISTENNDPISVANVNDEIEEQMNEDQRSENDNNDELEKRRADLKYKLRKQIKESRNRRFNIENYDYTSHNQKSKKTQDEYLGAICHLLTKAENNQFYDKSSLHRNVVGLCMMQMDETNLSQMHASKGIKVFGDRAIEALASEYSQLDGLVVFKPEDATKLTDQQKAAALNVIDLIKQKRCGKVKGRTVADGRKQRSEFNKEDTSSPAMSLEAFIVTLVVDAMEDRDVAITDVAGAFLKAEMPDYVIIRLHGSSLKAILRANKTKYEKYIVIENGREVLYVRLLKAMYGTLKAALLWYQLLSETLIKEGFKINPYDPCVANKDICGSQFTICWYVDDLKLSHVKSEEVTKMINTLESHFGKMNVTRGKSHTYLGIDFEIRKGKVILRMTDYLKECIHAYGEAINTSATSPANNGLMSVDENSIKLDESRKVKFHHITAKLLHICKRVRLDLQVAVGFLCTRVKNPTEQDWLKLRRVLQYIQGTLDIPRVISMDTLNEMDIYVDASHGIHDDKRGQTGGCTKMGTGVLHSRSSKQRINTLSSCETELVGNSEYLPYSIWLLYFLENQGYKVKKVRLQQDNQSTIKMLKNGRRSCGKRSRHVEQRFFWISDRLKNHSIEVKYCPTSLMLADFFTKPLQGSLFRDMRDVAQGNADYDVLTNKYSKSVLDESTDETKYDEDNQAPILTISDRKERVELYKNNNVTKVKNKDIMRTYADIVRAN